MEIKQGSLKYNHAQETQSFYPGKPKREKIQQTFLKRNQTNSCTIPIMKMNPSTREVCPPSQETLTRVANFPIQ